MFVGKPFEEAGWERELWSEMGLRKRVAPLYAMVSVSSPAMAKRACEVAFLI